VEETQAKVLLAQTRLLQDRAGDAQHLAQAAIDHVQGSALRERFPRLEAEAALRLGQAEQRAGDLGSARVHLDRALELREATDAPNSPWLAEVRIALADCLLDMGERKAARALVEKAQAAHAANADLGEHFKAPLRAILARGMPR
jgi:tetratricopeptide (TPR) repeat protein